MTQFNFGGNNKKGAPFQKKGLAETNLYTAIKGISVIMIKRV